MTIKDIRALAKVMRESQLSSMEVDEGEFHVKLTRDSFAKPSPSAAYVPLADDDEDEFPVRYPQDMGEDENRGLDFNNVKTVDSPMVGVFYQSPAPGEAPFVQLGSKVKKGDVLCIIEAMKLMNEIVAKQDGEIVDIMAEDGDVVEFGQTLFKLV